MSKKLEILKSATHLFAAKGFKPTSMAEVAAMTGTAGSNIFYHYKTKEDIFLAILKTIKDELLSQMETHMRRQRFGNGLVMLEAMVACYLDLAAANSEWFMLLHHRFPYELAEVNSICREHLEAIYTCFIDQFEKAIRTGQADGSILKTSARKAAMVIFAMVDGVVRFNTYNLYEAGSLYGELGKLCRRMLQSTSTKRSGRARC
jgi:AcrR family transcriptional regulator